MNRSTMGIPVALLFAIGAGPPGCGGEPDRVDVRVTLSADFSHVLLIEKRWNVRERVGPAGDFELSNPRYRWSLVTLDGEACHTVGWQDGELGECAVSDALRVSCLTQEGEVRVTDVMTDETFSFRDQAVGSLDRHGRFGLAVDGDPLSESLWYVDLSTGQPTGPRFSREYPGGGRRSISGGMVNRPGLYIENLPGERAWVFEPLVEPYEVVPPSPYCAPDLAYRFTGCGDPEDACDVAPDGSVAVSAGIRDGELTLLVVGTPTRISDDELSAENMPFVDELGRPLTGDPDCWDGLVRR